MNAFRIENIRTGFVAESEMALFDLGVLAGRSDSAIH